MPLIGSGKGAASAAGDALVFFVNGKKIVEPNPDPECTLLTYIREKLFLTGSKLGCGDGGCGVCTVMISKINRSSNTLRHIAVNACLIPICAVHGMAITTIEGIGSTRTRLHPIQEKIAKSHGSQCGFCTPGIVMSMYALLRTLPNPSQCDLEKTFQGNLCRCTGYRPIMEGFQTFTKEFVCAMGENCCKNKPNNNSSGIEEAVAEHKNEFIPVDPSQEPIFPPELKLSNALDCNSIVFKGLRVIWHRPTSLKELLRLKKAHPHAKIVVGSTDLSVDVKFKKLLFPIMICASAVPELTKVEITSRGICIGASCSLTELETVLEEQLKSESHETRLYKTIVAMLQRFGGRQVRNVGSVGGNIMNCSPVSDLNPIFSAFGVDLTVVSAKRGKRVVKMDGKFFTGYRQNSIEQDEVLVSVFLPKTTVNQYVMAYKQSKRREDDIAIVTAAFYVKFYNGLDRISELRLAFGGMSDTTVVSNVNGSNEGFYWKDDIVEVINCIILKDHNIDYSAPGGLVTYRMALASSLFFKFYLSVAQELDKILPKRIGKAIDDYHCSGADVFKAIHPSGSQVFEQVPGEQKSGDPVGRPIIHQSAFKQATGEAIYCDDMPKLEGELYLGFVLSTKAHANIVSIDASKALEMPGVHAFFSAKDLTPDQNQFGVIVEDERVFVDKLVTSHGQPIGVVAADTKKIAQEAARLVNVEYEELSPVIVTLEDAVAIKSFLPNHPKIISIGDVDSSFRKAEHIIEGIFRVGGQEHFYLETNVSCAIPKDSDEIELYCSSQHPAEIQKVTAKMLSIPASNVTVKVKRIGGGFGGKETRPMVVAFPVALAAYRLRRPVRCVLDRNEDICMTGGRHPFLFKYKIGCGSDGKIDAIHVDMYLNGGYSMDISCAALERAMHHCMNAYYVPNVLINGWICRTNLPTNTAFRGTGGPQSMLLAEHMMRDVAIKTGLDYIKVAELNFFQQGQVTHYHQEISGCRLDKCWEQCLKNSNYVERKRMVDEFNQAHRWRKRGITLVPTMFGVGFTAAHLNQAGALLQIYCDGSVLIAHGGTEMGQGVHTKMIQIAARALDIPIDRIKVIETATDKVPNTSTTGASLSSDLYGMAVLNACDTINERLQPYKEKLTDGDWLKWVNAAYLDRVSLSTTGFYANKLIGYDLDTNSGMAYYYYVYGAGCSEVEIDCLTGDHQVIRSDLVMDIGSSLNPAIDIGQIEGAFMMGYGLYTLEEVMFKADGTPLSTNTGLYKIPGFGDIPGELNVAILSGAPNPRAIYSSKAVGEPPLFLAASAFFAIKEAILAARKDAHVDPNFMLMSPATSERIRMACQDQITRMFEEPDPGTYIPWNVMA